MTEPLRQEDLVPGRGDKRVAQAYRQMMAAFQQGKTTEAAQEAVQIDLSQLDQQQVAEYQQTLQRIKDLDGQARAIIERADNYQPRSGSARDRVTEARAAKGNNGLGIPRIYLIGGGVVALLGLMICVWAVFLRGGSDVAPAAAVATAQPTKQASTMGQVGPDGKPVVDTMMTGAVFVSGDLKLMLSTDGGSVELNTTAADGEFRIADQVVGTITPVDGGKRLTFNGQVAVSVKLIKVDASLPPVTMYMGARKFTALALLDGQYQLVTFDEAGQAKQPLKVDPKTDAEGGVGLKNSPIVRVTDDGNGLLFTFPKAQPMPTPDPNAPTATPAAQG